MVRTFMVMIAVSAAVVLAAPVAAGAQWFDTGVVLGFGATYSGLDGQPRTHRGVDLACDAGATVESPVTGIVVFAGSIPAQDGGTVRALSVDTAAGRVALMPFERLDAAAGDRVESGDVVGTLAGEGDPSLDVAHLHLSLRSGGLYLDPTALLSAPAPLGADQGQTCAVPAGATAPVIAGGDTAEILSGGGVAPLAEGVSLPADAPVTEQVGGLVGSPAPVNVETGRASAHALQDGAVANALGEGVCLAPLPASPVGRALPSAQSGVTGRSDSTLEAAAQGAGAAAASVTRQLSQAGLPAYLGIVVAIASAVLILSVRAFERRICVDSPVSDRLGRLLQQLRTGDTLHGLTSCPGESAFTVPGPSSPREVTK